MSESQSLGKFLTGAIVGGAVGAVIGMLLAPRSGSETRDIIREEFEHRYRDSADALREGSEHLKEKASVLKDKVKDFSGDLEEKGQQVISRFTDKKHTETPS